MKAGDLRHRVTIQRQRDPQTRDVLGEQVTPWTELATVWAAVDVSFGVEGTESARETAQVTYRVRMRTRDDLSIVPSMRVRYASKTLDILSVTTANKPGETILTCREVI